jgi:hypothetical protein
MRNATSRMVARLGPWLLLPSLSGWIAVTTLKETPLFWRNAGGYPAGLRAAVLHGYYPATLLLIVGCAVGGVVALRSSATHSRVQLTGWTLCALILGAGLALLLANNLINLLDGRPLHYHAPL